MWSRSISLIVMSYHVWNMLLSYTNLINNIEPETVCHLQRYTLYSNLVDSYDNVNVLDIFSFSLLVSNVTFWHNENDLICAYGLIYSIRMTYTWKIVMWVVLWIVHITLDMAIHLLLLALIFRIFIVSHIDVESELWIVSLTSLSLRIFFAATVFLELITAVQTRNNQTHEQKKKCNFFFSWLHF